MTQQPGPLTHEFLNRLHAFVRGRVRSDQDADDIVQDVLAKLVTKGKEVQAGSVHAWLFTVARRAVVDHFRNRREHSPLSEDVPAELPESYDGTVAAELARCLEPMLTSLSEADRSILARVDMAGGSQATLARELGVSASVVKSRVQRARARLRGILTDCCAVEQDGRGTPLDYRQRPGQSCPCGADPSKPCDSRDGLTGGLHAAKSERR